MHALQMNGETSLKQWFKKTSTTADEKKAFSSSKMVEAAERQERRVGRNRKLSQQHCYADDIRTKVGKYTTVNGNKKAVAKFPRY